MKLNPDCIRDVLLYLEENLKISEREFLPVTLATLEEKITQYPKEDVFYSVYNLRQIGFIEGTFKDTITGKMQYCNIENITYAGHQFLATVKPDTIWNGEIHSL